MYWFFFFFVVFYQCLVYGREVYGVVKIKEVSKVNIIVRCSIEFYDVFNGEVIFEWYLYIWVQFVVNYFLYRVVGIIGMFGLI